MCLLFLLLFAWTPFTMETPPPQNELILVTYEDSVALAYFYCDRYDAIGWYVQPFGKKGIILPHGIKFDAWYTLPPAPNYLPSEGH